MGYTMGTSAVKLAALLLCAVVLLCFPECNEAKLRPRRGYHNIGLNQQSINYGYKGKNGWNVNGNYNWQDKSWGVGIGFKFRKRNQILAPYSDQNKTPADRLIEITDDLAAIKSELSETALTKLALPRHDQPITDEILLRDIRCLRHQIMQVVPQIKAFVDKVTEKFGVGSVANEGVSGCKSLEGEQTATLTGNDLVQMKKFTLALITTEVELQAKPTKGKKMVGCVFCK